MGVLGSVGIPWGWVVCGFIFFWWEFVAEYGEVGVFKK
jgi:hypothetical protein